MSPSSSAVPNRAVRPSKWRRWLALGLLSVLLHLVALKWAGNNFSFLSSTSDEPRVFHAELQQPPAPASPPPPDPAPSQTKKIVTPKPRKPAASPPAVATAPQTGEPSAAPTEPPAPVVEAPVPNEAAPTVANESTEADRSKRNAPVADEGLRYKINPPPSAQLKYDVKALRSGTPTYGVGSIEWKTDGGRYSIAGDVGILIFFISKSVLSFHSNGVMDEFGIAPVLYAEKRLNKSEINTHFSRDRNLISFSASTRSYPIKGGEQDRASIIWQLAGIGRGDRDKIVPNAQIPVFVAGARDGEVWNIQIIGEEEVEVGLGKLAAWHVVRVPRPGSYDQKLDIWFAPQHEWYPVRLRYTENNGDYIDMTLSSISPPAQP